MKEGLRLALVRYQHVGLSPMIKAVLAARKGGHELVFFSVKLFSLPLQPLSLFIIANFSSLPLAVPPSISRTGRSIRSCAKQSVPGGAQAFAPQRSQGSGRPSAPRRGTESGARLSLSHCVMVELIPLAHAQVLPARSTSIQDDSRGPPLLGHQRHQEEDPSSR